MTDRDPLHYERYGNTRYWKTVEGSRLLGVIVYKKGAKTVADRITELKQEIGGYCLSNDPLIFFPIVGPIPTLVSPAANLAAMLYP